MTPALDGFFFDLRTDSIAAALLAVQEMMRDGLAMYVHVSTNSLTLGMSTSTAMDQTLRVPDGYNIGLSFSGLQTRSGFQPTYRGIAP